MEIPIADICENIPDEVGKRLTAEVLRLFCDGGLTVRVKDDGSRYRVFCYIKKSKESVILGTMDKRREFIVQLRVADRSLLDRLGDLPENVRDSMLHGPDCRGGSCRNCEAAYRFTYDGKAYHKCHTLMCNFIYRNPQEGDIVSIIEMVGNEIRFSKVGKKRAVTG